MIFTDFKLLANPIECITGVLKQFMSKVLRFEDFRWVLTNEEKKDGYFSLKKDCWELAIDFDLHRGWTVYVCNKFEEVLEEYGCTSQDEAIRVANKIYKTFNHKLTML